MLRYGFICNRWFAERGWSRIEIERAGVLGGGGFVTIPDTHGRTNALERKAVFLVCLFIILWLLAWFVYGYGYFEDDAFIHLEFARSLFRGDGFSFNGRVVYGDTSPLWVFLLVGTHSLISNWILAGKALAAISGIGALLSLYVLALKLAPKGIAPRFFAAVAVLLLAVNPYFVFWFLSGMETMLAIAFALWIIRAASVAPTSWTNLWLGCVLCGLAPLLRPEFVFLDVIVSPFLFERAWRLTNTKSLGTRLAVFAVASFLAAAPLAAWMFYAQEVFGTIIANTSAAKRDANDSSVVWRIVEVLSFGFPLITVFAIVFPVIAVVGLFSHTIFERIAYQLRNLPSAFWITFAWSLVICSFYVWNRTYIQTRYVLIFATPLTLLILLLIFSFNEKSVLYTVSLGTALAAVVVSLAVARPFIRNKVESVAKMRELAEFIKTRLPLDKPVASYTIGQLAFQSEHSIIDTGGIVNPAVIPFVNSLALRANWAKQQGAAYLEGGDDEHLGPGAVFIFEATVHFAGWTVHPGKFREPQVIRLWSLTPATSPAGGNPGTPTSERPLSESSRYVLRIDELP